MIDYDDDETERRKRQGVIDELIGDQPVVKITDPPIEESPFQGGTSASAPAPQTQPYWGFTSATGGRAERPYTPQTYGGGYDNFSGFRDMSTLDQDPNAASSLKYIFARAAEGLGGGEGGYTEADLDETIRRLNEQGVQARKVDPYQIDFGLGEGPMQVRSSKNQVWWNNRATEGQGGQAAGGMGATGLGGSPAIATGGEGGDALSRIQALIAALLSRG